MTEVFAHRGAHGVERENTLGAFRAARDLAVAGVELDVRQTRDGVLVVHHDPVAEGVVIAHALASDLPDFIPTLAAALEVLEGVTVNVEVKNFRDPHEPTYDESGALVRDVVEVLHGAESVARVILSCFDLTTCAQARDYDLDVRVAWLVWDVPLTLALTKAHVLGFDAVNPYFALISAESQREARDLGLAINAWTVNDSSDIVAMGEFGVTSVITDEPARAMVLLSSTTRRARGDDGLD